MWHGEITPRRPRRGADLPPDSELAPLALERGAEMGRFNMGSTVILLLPPRHRRSWLPAFAGRDRRVRVGQPLARLA